MITLKFLPEDPDLFSNLYFSFITSERTAKNIEELPIVLKILNGLQSISEPIPETRIRKLKEDGGELILEDVEKNFLKQAISPPFGKWTNEGILILLELLKRLDGKK